MSDIPWDDPCEKHKNSLYLSKVPNDWESCYGCFLEGREKEKLQAAEKACDSWQALAKKYRDENEDLYTVKEKLVGHLMKSRELLEEAKEIIMPERHKLSKEAWEEIDEWLKSYEEWKNG